MFYNCTNLNNIKLSYFDNNIIEMQRIFIDCSSLTSLDLSKFNTNNVTNMLYMFYNCSSLTSLDLSKFNTNNVTYMDGMFNGLNKNCNIISNDKKINELKSSCMIF